jgi:hypothetical protein
MTILITLEAIGIIGAFIHFLIKKLHHGHHPHIK